LAALLQVSSGQPGLSSMHSMSLAEDQEVPLCPKVMHAFKFAGQKMPQPWRRALMRERKLITLMERSLEYQHFLAVYARFVEEVIVPLCGDSSIQCQCPPTVRVHMPSQQPTIPAHTDSEYEGHEASEINFWVPVTRVWGNNTLWCETQPGLKDFHPVEIEYGNILRFNGNRCTHFTKSNDTGATRVSFDFRAIPGSLHQNIFEGKIGDYKSKLFTGKMASQNAEPCVL